MGTPGTTDVLRNYTVYLYTELATNVLSAEGNPGRGNSWGKLLTLGKNSAIKGLKLRWWWSRSRREGRNGNTTWRR